GGGGSVRERVVIVGPVLVGDAVLEAQIERSVRTRRLQELGQRHRPVISPITAAKHPLIGDPVSHSEPGTEIRENVGSQRARKMNGVRADGSKSSRRP